MPILGLYIKGIYILYGFHEVTVELNAFLF